MKNYAIKTRLGLLAASLLVVSSSAWSATIAESPLDPNYYTHAPFFPRIDMTHLALEYEKDSAKLGGQFEGQSEASSTFMLYKPDHSAQSFKGKFEVNALIDASGKLQGNANSFSILSDDASFGFGKDKNGTNTWGNLFSGKLTDVGWSAAGNRLEFATAAFSGKACDLGWCSQAERLFFNVDGFPTSGWTKSWENNSVAGTAVIPVPAAVWLLGSGLIGLFGASKRKKNLLAALPA